MIKLYITLNEDNCIIILIDKFSKFIRLIFDNEKNSIKI